VGRDPEKQKAHKAAYAKRMRERRAVDPEYAEYLRQRKREWEVRVAYRKQGETRDKSIAYKREERRKQAEAQGRVIGQRWLHNAHVKEWERSKKKKVVKCDLHDAHVKALRGNNAVYWKWRYRNDPEFNLQERFRASLKKKKEGMRIGEMIRYAFRNPRTGKTEKTLQAVCGYTAKELRDHLERQFTKGMTWDRFMAAEIHIDHIVPKSAFDLRSPSDLRACWALSNLRPLWASDNMRKADKRVTLL